MTAKGKSASESPKKGKSSRSGASAPNTPAGRRVLSLAPSLQTLTESCFPRKAYLSATSRLKPDDLLGEDILMLSFLKESTPLPDDLRDTIWLLLESRGTGTGQSWKSTLETPPPISSKLSVETDLASLFPTLSTEEINSLSTSLRSEFIHTTEEDLIL